MTDLRMRENVSVLCVRQLYAMILAHTRISYSSLLALGLGLVLCVCSGLAFVCLSVLARNSTKSVCLPDKASIFRAEPHAISLAMDFIRHSKNTRFIVFSDSKSSLEAIIGFRTELDLVLKIIKDYSSLIKAK